MPAGLESAKQPHDGKVAPGGQRLLQIKDDLGLYFRLACILFDRTHDLDGNCTFVNRVPHLDDASKRALSQLSGHSVSRLVESVALAQHVVMLGTLCCCF